jgi:serine/threonine-protein kinase
MSLLPGTRLGPYEVTAPLGAGGMGEVYRATDTELKRSVALKVLPAAVAADADRLARFKREAEVLAALNHPHIAQIYGLEKGPGATALVMELVEGEDLSQRIAPGPVAPDEALPIAKQIAEALEAAHEQGIIHRDLKPANIKVRDDGTVKVLDFGLAKALDSGTGLARRSPGEGGEPGAGKTLADSPTITSPAMTQAGIILGTAAYMAPEQAKGRAVDKRADIWAFGCVLYEMLTGRRAFDGEDMTDVLSRVLQREPDWTLLPRNLPPHLTTLLARCIEKDPRRRLRDIGDVRLVLEGAFDAAAPAGPDQSRAHPAIWLRMAAALATGILLTAAAAAVLWPRPQPAPIVRFTTDLQVGLLDLYRGAVAVSPDGRHVVAPALTGLRIKDTDALGSRMLYTAGAASLMNDAGAAPTWPAFSPDGQSIVFAEANQLMRIGLSGGPPTVVASAPSHVPGVSWDVLGVSWTTPETIVFAQSDGIKRVAASGGTPELVSAARPGEAMALPQLLPDGRTLLYTVARGRWNGAQIVVQRIGSEERTVLVSGGFAARYVRSGHVLYVADDKLMALRFDAAALKPVGEPRPVLDGVHGSSVSGAAPFDVAENGTLAYVPPPVFPPTTIVWVDRTGREAPIAAPERPYDGPRVSPGGDRLSFGFGFAGDSGAWVYSLSRNVLERLDDLAAAGMARWSPDGQHVVFYGEHLTEGPGLFRRRADGAGQPERLATGNYVPTSWSADGRQIVYLDFGAGRPGTPGQQPDLSVLTLEGSRPTTKVLMKTPAWEDDAALSPDGRWLAYETNEASGGILTEILVRQWPDIERGRWRISDAGGFDPVWSRDGRTLFNRSGRAVKSVAVPARARPFR